MGWFGGTRICESIVGVWQRMGRTKTVDKGLLDTPLKRCLTTLDITLLGIGHMVGAGIYVLTGTVAKDVAGPAIVLSFLLAGFTSLLAALCYAEFGARVPKAGSAYVYTYVTVGEFWAFVIGWNIVLEHMIGAASVARAWSGYVDALFAGAISNATSRAFGTTPETIHPDPIAFTVVLIYCGLLSLGVKSSAYLNSTFTLINMAVMLFVILFGLCFADVDNWKANFMPFGMSGVLAGAGASFYAFVGFDSIATAGEEAKNPSKSIPAATLISMGVVTLGYVLVGAALTLMVPYDTLNPSAAIPDAFAARGVVWAKYVISVGALCGMTTTLFGSLFSLPRCVYAMASDGLLFSWLSRVSDTTQVPVLNLLICGFMSALIALVFDIEKLVEFMSIGTLLAYTIVSASVIILRYQPSSRCNIKNSAEDESPTTPTAPQDFPKESNDCGGQLYPAFKWVEKVLGSHEEGSVVSWTVAAFTLSSAIFCIILQYSEYLFGSSSSAWSLSLTTTLLIAIMICVWIVIIHQQNNLKLSFTVPLVPLVPLLSIFANVSLMVHLSPLTWARFVIWMAIGLVFYFGYGIRNSKESEPVSSYSTLLAPPQPASKTVFGSVQQTLSQVGSKIASTVSQDHKPLQSAEDD